MAKMTNSEKYLRDGVDVKQMATEMVDYFNFPPYEGIGENSIEEFFGKEVKPTLTEDERVILKFIENFDYIGRNEKGLYYKLQDKDIKEKTAVIYNLATNLFQFIKERRRILNS